MSTAAHDYSEIEESHVHGATNTQDQILEEGSPQIISTIAPGTHKNTPAMSVSAYETPMTTQQKVCILNWNWGYSKVFKTQA